MAKDFDLQENFLSSDLSPDRRLASTATVAPTSEEVAPTLDCPVWEPLEPQYCKAVASYYQVESRTVQRTKKKIQESLPWLVETDLRLPDDRYTPLCVRLMGDYWQSGLKIGDWKSRMWQRYPAEVQTYQKQNDVPLSPTEVLPRENQNPADGDRLSGMVLHFGSSLALPTIPGIVAPGDDTAYLTQVQQRLQQFEAMQQQVIAQMQQQQQEAEALNAQYQEATSLSDQLLLQEFQLRGVQLGHTALQLKQQAFKATIQAAEAGTLPVPGKPQIPSTPAPAV